jgi:hypothetical protein
MPDLRTFPHGHRLSELSSDNQARVGTDVSQCRAPPVGIRGAIQRPCRS